MSKETEDIIKPTKPIVSKLAIATLPFRLLAHLLRSSFATASLRDATSLACEITGKLLDATQGIIYAIYVLPQSKKVQIKGTARLSKVLTSNQRLQKDKKSACGKARFE